MLFSCFAWQAILNFVCSFLLCFIGAKEVLKVPHSLSERVVTIMDKIND